MTHLTNSQKIKLLISNNENSNKKINSINDHIQNFIPLKRIYTQDVSLRKKHPSLKWNINAIGYKSYVNFDKGY
ncbi:hypothetical protein H8356DRAFT_1349514 [Neocallimastix lanati (nom. inval.)]|nr:hypothetical protein H8356DRAFT_1349514 [Neocallimastix sp. JGI-2020a]